MARRREPSPSPRPDASAHRRPDEAGFTLVEVLVAAIVLTVALVALAELLAVGARLHQVGRGSGTAALLASDKFEELMKLDFDTAPAVQITAADTLATNIANYFDVPAGSGYTRRWRVQPGPGGHAALRTVTIRLVPEGNAGAGLEITSILRSW